MTTSGRRMFRRARSAADGALVAVSRARDALAAGDAPGARSQFQQAMEEASADVAVQLSVAQAMSEAGFLHEALSVHRRLLERPDPPSASILAVAAAFVDAGRHDPAIQLLVSAVSARPGELALRFALAAAYEHATRWVEAREQARLLLAVAPADPDIHRLHARLSARLGDTAACAQAWRTVVALTGGADREARTALGIALSNAGRYDEAIRELSEVAALEDSADAHANLGMALLEAGRAPEALTALRRATAASPRHAQAQVGIGVALLALDAVSDAIAALRVATELAPDSAITWFNLALAQRKSGALPDARRSLVRAAGLSPNDPSITELLEELASPQTSGSGDVQITGDLTSFPLPDLIEFLRSGAKTGTVVISAPAGAGLVSLDHGRITAANAPSSRRLGIMLVERGAVDRRALERALSVQSDAPEQSARIGAALLRARLVDRETLSRVVLEQTLSALEEILSWSEGSFSFHRRRDDAGTPDDERISFDAQFVMMELMRVMDERQRKPRGDRPK